MTDLAEKEDSERSYSLEKAAEEEAAAPRIEIEMSAQDLEKVFAGELDIDEVIARIQEQKQREQGPLPTLESIRATIARWKESWITDLAVCQENRVKMRGNSAAQTVLAVLHDGDYDAVRRTFTSVQKDSLCEELVAQLSDEELGELSIAMVYDATPIAAALGLYVGALLGQEGFQINDVLRLARDPVFVLQVCKAKLNQDNACNVASATLRDIAASDAKD